MRRGLWVSNAILVICLGSSTTAWAGCEKDTDCKGDRICEAGECVAPSWQPSMQMLGVWKLALTAEEQATLDEAKARLKQNPEDVTSKATVAMMSSMATMSLTVREGEMVMAMGRETETARYSVVSQRPLKIQTTDKNGVSEVLEVTFRADGVMVWTKPSEPKPILWQR